MQNIFQKIKLLETQAQKYEKDSKFKECMDIHQQIITLKRNAFGENSQEYNRSSYKLCEICNLVSMIFLQKQKYDLCHVFLKKAESLANSSNYHKAVTFNNMACYFRKVNKFRLALTYLQNALALELKLDHPMSIADTHLNLCAVLSQLGKHQEALQHILLSIVLLQDELLKAAGNKNPQRISVLAIAYHNMGVQLQYLKRFQQSINAYKKAVQFGQDNMPPEDNLVKNLVNVLENAEETVKNIQIKKKTKKIDVDKFQKVKSIYGQKERPQTAKNYFSAKPKLVNKQ